MESKIIFDNIETIVLEAKNGQPFIIVDDENRENEGDIIAPANAINKDIINIMKEAGGLICVAIDHKIYNQFKLELHPRRNIKASETNFTLSVDATSDIGTGISSQDRATTIKIFADPNGISEDFQSPGHVFPVLAHKDGLKKRKGHTEASIEIAKLADIPGAMVMCEIINKDGTMARNDDLYKFAKSHAMKVSSVDLLYNYLFKK